MIAMSDKPLAQKLFIKEGYKVFIVNAPPGYKSKIGGLHKMARMFRLTTIGRRCA